MNNDTENICPATFKCHSHINHKERNPDAKKWGVKVIFGLLCEGKALLWIIIGLAWVSLLSGLHFEKKTFNKAIKAPKYKKNVLKYSCHEVFSNLFSETPDCKLYFTSDGTKPAPFQRKVGGREVTFKYVGPFTLKPGKRTLKAVAVSRYKLFTVVYENTHI